MIASEEVRMRNFRLLTARQQLLAIRRLDDEGYSAHGIAAATGLAVEQIARVLAEVGRRSRFVGLPMQPQSCEVSA